MQSIWTRQQPYTPAALVLAAAAEIVLPDVRWLSIGARAGFVLHLPLILFVSQ